MSFAKNDNFPTANRNVVLVTGAARSGKSEWAETLAIQGGKPVIYVATARVDWQDEDWCARIEKHQQRRPAHWQTWSVPVALPDAVDRVDSNYCLLVDSLGTWVANFLDANERSWQSWQNAFCRSLANARADVILVAEEVGWGVVPPYPQGRHFRDRLGELVRRVGAIAHPVYLIVAGQVLNLSVLGFPLAIQPSDEGSD
ncbi:bifunctional adenosylcobinamide kinase/adenosylcobinamide-phosphate guanylyltransferase [Geitlerinema sp. PCC 9228]|jgi:adenosylcobinamide kinase/adenosylcobinamide-phosphate guanylyltransferase|uniref:bifunctional adenosylcobinamide kinase/adenosylcobinamide-phosphate guanylyltransferase n=1 Tax=Geitlerinema sp. PCC 9228 TaxID=111611 RepID=UPI0008F9A848|nr:bifunctional adenosylcobinamide kinase/adenosylcobinamide-phosphate guanylyltransferase [Geitlerinema sp. PCC 9228]